MGVLTGWAFACATSVTVPSASAAAHDRRGSRMPLFSPIDYTNGRRAPRRGPQDPMNRILSFAASFGCLLASAPRRLRALDCDAVVRYLARRPRHGAMIVLLVA